MIDFMDKWAEVTAELEAQLRLPPELHFDAERRGRTTMHCQRLLSDHHVTLAVPVIGVARPDTDDWKGRYVVAFTDRGPWLFTAGKGNPGLPRTVVGEISDAAPITFAPHHREGGMLTFGERSFLVPYLYAESVRNVIIAMSKSQDSQ